MGRGGGRRTRSELESRLPFLLVPNTRNSSPRLRHQRTSPTPPISTQARNKNKPPSSSRQARSASLDPEQRAIELNAAPDDLDSPSHELSPTQQHLLVVFSPSKALLLARRTRRAHRRLLPPSARLRLRLDPTPTLPLALPLHHLRTPSLPLPLPAVLRPTPPPLPPPGLRDRREPRASLGQDALHARVRHRGGVDPTRLQRRFEGVALGIPPRLEETLAFASRTGADVAPRVPAFFLGCGGEGGDEGVVGEWAALGGSLAEERRGRR